MKNISFMLTKTAATNSTGDATKKELPSLELEYPELPKGLLDIPSPLFDEDFNRAFGQGTDTLYNPVSEEKVERLLSRVTDLDPEWKIISGMSNKIKKITYVMKKNKKGSRRTSIFTEHSNQELKHQYLKHQYG